MRVRNAKKRGGDREELPFEELENLFSSKGDPPTEMEQILLTETLNRFLAELDSDKRNLFVARYWYASSLESLCEQFGWGKSRIKMTLLRLREKLRKKLREEGL